MTTDPPQHGSEPDSSRGESDGQSEDRPVDRLDETESIDPRARPAVPRIAIEGYDIIRELHRGGQGVVYEAVQKSTKRKVAIKVLLEGQLASASAKRRFEREVTLAAALKHPNIIAIFDSGEMEDGHKFCVMDYVRGTTIREHIRQNKLSLEETLELFCSVCEAVHFAHQKGVIHRDLKPSNILADTDGVPKVLDFGLAKQLAGGAESLVSMTGQVVGTLPYMSPEQTRGNPDEIDARSDVYALGVILYELLTGQHPYPVKGEMYEVIKHITETEPTPPSKVWTAKSGVARRKSGRLRVGQCPIDGELQTIAIKALAKERERRYQSADALRQDIASYLAGDPIEAKRDSSLYVLRKSLRRHRIPIAVMFGFVAVAAAALYVGSRTGGPTAPAPVPIGPITSLAVLPLENLSGDPDQDFFADGMTGELITTLGRIKALKVISRTSAMRYKRTSKAPHEIARELGVDALLEGTIARSGGRIRITANLTHAATSQHLWGDSYEHDLRDVFTLQNEVAQAIAREIRINLTPQDQMRLTATRRVEPSAHEAYLRGRYHLDKVTPEGMAKSIDYFVEATAADPGYALAYVGLGEAYFYLGYWGCMPGREAYPKANAAAHKALGIDVSLAEAHATLAMVRVFEDWDLAAAEAGLQRAIALNPAYAPVRYWYSAFLSAVGRRDEAWAELREARRLDPLSLPIMTQKAWKLHLDRRYEDAIEQCRKALEMDPSFPTAHLILAFAKTEMERYDEAISEIEALRRRAGVTPPLLAALGRAYALAGNADAAHELIAELGERWERESLSAGSIGIIYTGLGDHDKAFEWLERSCEARESHPLWLNTAPVYDDLRDDPRFDALLRRIGFPVSPESHPIAEAPAGKATDGKIRLAVLPFEDLSPEPQEWFSDGMTGELIATLGKIEALGVISRTSAMRYKDTVMSVPEIARELSVGKIVEGSVLRLGGRVRITVELIDAATDTHLWSNSYERDLRDVLALQGDLARSIAREIKIAVTPAEESRLANTRQVNLEAYRFCLQGQSYTYEWTSGGFKKAVESFEQAIAVDPTCAPAFAGLAEVYLWQGLLGGGLQEAYSKAMAAAKSALEFDDTLGLPHATLGTVKFFVDWDWHSPEKDFQRGLELSPGDAHVHYLYSFYLILSGRFDEGIKESKRAVELDPFQFWYCDQVAFSFMLAQRHEEAIAQYKKLIEKKPDEPFYHVALANNYAASGMYDEALAECAKMGGCRGETAWVYAVAGKRQRALNEIDRFKMHEPVNAWPIAVIYAGLGEKEEAFQWLEKAHEDRNPMVPWFNIAHKLDPLRDDPRFDDLLRRVGFEPPSIPVEQKP